MFKVILIMEKKDYEDRPKAVVLDKLDQKSYVTFNFGIEPSANGFSCYSATVVFRENAEHADGVLSQLVSTGMIGYVKPEEIKELAQTLPCEDPLSFVMDYQKERIKSYDSSPSVNEFTLQGTPMWLDKSTRSGLKLRLEAEQSAGKEGTTLWYGMIAVTLPVSTAIDMLNRLEVYASECYDRTQQHLATVNDLESVEAVLAYDFADSYPEKLNF